jgi:hypothetical protein
MDPDYCVVVRSVEVRARMHAKLLVQRREPKQSHECDGNPWQNISERTGPSDQGWLRLANEACQGRANLKDEKNKL